MGFQQELWPACGPAQGQEEIRVRIRVSGEKLFDFLILKLFLSRFSFEKTQFEQQEVLPPEKMHGHNEMAQQAQHFPK